MAYKYYCTDCGQTISQETVLFNMQNLVLEDENQSFQNLTMYMSLYQIDQMLARGTLLDSGYRSIRLTFTEVMQIISGYFNLNKAELASLTLEQIKEYLRPVNAEPVIRRAPTKRSTGLRFALKTGDEEPVQVEVDDTPEEEEAPKQQETPPAILALNEIWGGTAGDQMIEQNIRAELEMLQRAFGDQDFLEVQITPRTEEDNDKNPVVVGYQYIYPKSGKHSTHRLRVCPKCHSLVYEYAGRAEHQTVVFMGTQGSGKTSAILAMTHFLHKSMDPIWENCTPVNQISFLLDEYRETKDDSQKEGDKKRIQEQKSKALARDLEWFKIGEAPARTDKQNRENAYSASFWFYDVEAGGHLLTLTDMPGEMMGPNSPRIKEENLRNSHQAALCCDAFVICFDATTVFRAIEEEDGDAKKQEIRSNAKKEVLTLVDKLDQLQRLRREMIRERDGAKANLSYVPTLVLITKDAEIERQTEKAVPKTAIPMELLYCFQAEREYIQSNVIYNSVLETMSKYDELRRSYHAMLRCSPYGYNAPSEEDIKEKRRKREEIRTPTPKNIDEVVHWILKLVGILPAAGTLAMEDGSLTRENYRFSRVQYRSEKPKEGEELEEALSRCTLFENPGYFDEQVVEAHTEGFFAKLRLKTSMMTKWLTNDTDPK